MIICFNIAKASLTGKALRFFNSSCKEPLLQNYKTNNLYLEFSLMS